MVSLVAFAIPGHKGGIGALLHPLLDVSGILSLFLDWFEGVGGDYGDSF